MLYPLQKSSMSTLTLESVSSQRYKPSAYEQAMNPPRHNSTDMKPADKSQNSSTDSPQSGAEVPKVDTLTVG